MAVDPRTNKTWQFFECPPGGFDFANEFPCCDNPQIAQFAEAKVAQCRRDSDFQCPGATHDGKFFRYITLSASLVSLACDNDHDETGGLIDAGDFPSGYGPVAAVGDLGADAVCIDGDDGALCGNTGAGGSSGSVTIPVGQYPLYSYSSEVTEAAIMAHAKSCQASAPYSSGWGHEGYVEIDDQRSDNYRYYVYVVSAKVTLRHAVPLRGRGRCFRVTYQVLEIEPDDTEHIITEVDYEWDGTVPGGYDPLDPTTWPTIVTDLLIPVPALSDNNYTTYRLKPAGAGSTRPNWEWHCSHP